MYSEPPQLEQKIVQHITYENWDKNGQSSTESAMLKHHQQQHSLRFHLSTAIREDSLATSWHWGEIRSVVGCNEPGSLPPRKVWQHLNNRNRGWKMVGGKGQRFKPNPDVCMNQRQTGYTCHD